MNPPVLRYLIPFLLAVLSFAGGASAQRGAADPGPRAIVVPIHGELDTVTVRLVTRAVRTALAESMSRIVLDIDTPGGAVDRMREIEEVLAQLRGTGGIRTTAYVSHEALSAGGYLALACDDTFMARGAKLGAITPIYFGPGAANDLDTDVALQKLTAAFRADVRELVSRRGNASAGSLAIAEALVDPRVEVFEVVVVEANGLERSRFVDDRGLRDLAATGVRIVRQASLGRGPLVVSADEAVRYGFSSGTYDSLDDLAREQFSATPDRLLRIEPSWSETAVDWLEQMKLLLFVFGFVLLLIELKLPGFGVPGAVGLLLLGLGLFSSYLVGLADWTEFLLFFLGLGLIGVELFLMPGTVVFGLSGFLCVVAALVLSQQSFLWPANARQVDILAANLLDLVYLVLLVTAGAAAFYRFLPHIPLFNRALLEPPGGAHTGASTRFAAPVGGSAVALVGVEGVAVTDLRPAGLFEHGEGQRVDVVANGGFVARGTRVRVIDVGANRIVVEPVPTRAGGEAGEASYGLLFLLLCVGLALVVAEVFFPSLGLLSIAAAVALVSAVFLAFTQHGQVVGFVVLAIAAIGVPVALTFAFRLLPKTALGKKFMLEAPRPDEVRGTATEHGLDALLGKSGTTESVLRPAGFARIDGRRVDVVSRGEPIEVGVAVRVIQVDGNRVVVVPASPTHSAERQP